MAEIQLTDDAVEDLVGLDGSVLPRVLKKLIHLEDNPLVGDLLGKRSKSDLTTFRKLVVGNRDWRIIYRANDDGSIVVVWVIAGRSDDECYDEAKRRVEKVGTPETMLLLDALAQLSAAASRRARRIYPESR